MTNADGELGHIQVALGLDARGVARRKAFLGFERQDADNLTELHESLAGYAQAFIRQFYAEILSFEETRRLLPDQATVERLKSAQTAYFDSLTAGDYGEQYIRDRLRVGLVHHQVGLSPSLYIGAYSKYLVKLLPQIRSRAQLGDEDLIRAIQSLVKVVFFDMGLAIDTYIEARDQTISSLRRYSELAFESINDAIVVLSSDLRIQSANGSFLSFFDLTLGEIEGRALMDIVSSMELEAIVKVAAIEGAAFDDYPLRIAGRGSEEARAFRVTVKPVRVSGRDQVLIVMDKIGAEEQFRRQAEARLLRSETMLRRAQAVAKIGSWQMERVEAGYDRLEWSEETYRLFGVMPGVPVCYQSFLERVFPEDRAVVDLAWRAALDGAPYRVHHRVQVGEDIRWLECRAELEFDVAGSFVVATGTVQDISDHIRAERRIEQLAFYDSLTQLPNRALFHDRLQRMIASASRHDGRFALFFVDLDRFKEINDTQGHACGDEVLASVAGRFSAVLRDSDTLARFGGDEFVIIADQMSYSRAVLLAERLKRSLNSPVSTSYGRFSVGASVGIAHYPDDGEGAQQLLQHADIAMYHAKGRGKGYAFYSPGMGTVLTRKMEISQRLTHALGAGKLQLYYQPQFDLRTRRLVGAEALLRWHDEEWGWVSPGEFIPVAEARDIIVPLGEWVAETACKQLQAWLDAGLELPGRLALNVSIKQLEHPGFVPKLQAVLADAGLDADLLELEITESSMMIDPECAMRVTKALIQANFDLAIDDFGTGHSSLAYLRRFPAATLKIDKSFVCHMLIDPNDHAIVQTIVAMARTLGLKTLAEGVEESAQAAALLQMECDRAQGYFYGRPVSAEVFEAHWLRPALLEI